SAPLAGGFWAAGHLAGPVAAVYLWVDGRRRCRLAATVPLAATALAVVLSLAPAARPLDRKGSLPGRANRHAIPPPQRSLGTAQAIPENVVFGNLGLEVETAPIQAVVLTLGLILLWTSRRLAWRCRSAPAGAATPKTPGLPLPSFTFNPLECAGAALVLG